MYKRQGHCLYTDFLAVQTYNNYLSREKWYPEPPVYKLPKDTAVSYTHLDVYKRQLLCSMLYAIVWQ